MTRDNWQDDDFAAQWNQSDCLYTNPDRLNQLSLLARMVAEEQPGTLVDLGIGSAQVELAFKKYCPELFSDCHITGVDGSAAMLNLASEVIAKYKIPGIQLVQENFAHLESIKLGKPIDTVICVQALHEVDHDTKRAAFSWVYDNLAEGSPFYILDRFTYKFDRWKTDWKAAWEWMREGAEFPTLGFDEYHHRYQGKTDAVTSLSNYIMWLQQTGFHCVCPYRCFNRALIVARK
ncbi:MAG: class I SAM-dependent methyltransferase [Pseudomonadota bacterium]